MNKNIDFFEYLELYHNKDIELQPYQKKLLDFISKNKDKTIILSTPRRGGLFHKAYIDYYNKYFKKE